MNLGQFYARVSRALSRGDSLDTSIPDWTEEAVQEIENNYTFQYMRRWVDFSIDASASNPHVISLYNTPIKEVSLLRYTDPDTQRFKEVKGPKNPQDRATRPAGFPSSFWLNGVSDIILDSSPDEDFTMEGHLVAFTVWQPAELLFQHFLIDRYRTLILSQTIMQANMELKDPRLASIYDAMNQKAWTTAKVAEEQFQFGGETGAQMEYHPPYEEDDRGFEDSP